MVKSPPETLSPPPIIASFDNASLLAADPPTFRDIIRLCIQNPLLHKAKARLLQFQVNKGDPGDLKKARDSAIYDCYQCRALEERFTSAIVALVTSYILRCTVCAMYCSIHVCMFGSARRVLSSVSPVFTLLGVPRDFGVNMQTE